MLAWSPDGKELLYKKTIGGQKQLFKIDLHSLSKTPLALLGPTTRHGQKHRLGLVRSSSFTGVSQTAFVNNRMGEDENDRLTP